MCVRKDTTEKDFDMSAQVRVVACVQIFDFPFQFTSFIEMDGVPRDKFSLLLDKFAQGCLRLKCELKANSSSVMK